MPKYIYLIVLAVVGITLAGFSVMDLAGRFPPGRTASQPPDRSQR